MNQIELPLERRIPRASTNTIGTEIESNDINSTGTSQESTNSTHHYTRPRLEINQHIPRNSIESNGSIRPRMYIHPNENSQENIDSIHNVTRPRIDMNQVSHRRTPSGTENTLTNIIEPNGTRRSFRRTTSLPAYDDVISDETFAKLEETPPPNYNEITFSTIQGGRKRMAPLPPVQISGAPQWV